MAKGPRLALLFAAAVVTFEVLARYFPSALPQALGALASQRLLDREIYHRDPELGHCLKTGFERRFDWEGRRLAVRHATLPGAADCGYRAGPAGATAPEAHAAPQADIVVLGDSHVYGMEVDQESTWVSLLGRLSGLSVANLGVRMYGTTQAVELYRRYGSRLRPRLVLILICPNDPWDDAVFADWRAKRNIPPPLDSDAMLYRVCRTFRLETSPLACRALAGFGTLGLLPHLLLGRSVSLLYGRPSMEAITAERLAAMSLELRALREAASGPTALAAVINEGWAGEPRRELVKLLEDSRIPFLDVSVGADAGGERLHVALDGHWNVAGHRRMAESTHRLLAHKRLLPAPR